MVLGNGKRPGVCEEYERLRPFLQQHCQILLEDFTFSLNLESIQADLVLVLGGDGSILRAARQMGYHQIPVLGLNLGTLGFLADLSPDEIRTCFPIVVAGNYRTTSHLMFECLVQAPNFERRFLGLNEIVVRSGPPFHMIDLHLVIEEEVVARYSGDGLILSTPIGSTAQSLSAGGPILSQGLQAFLITPICPHTLTHRPLVDSAEKTYTLQINRAGESAMLVVDGQENVPLTMDHQITFRKAPVPFRLIKVPGRTYYQTLHGKLRWGDQPQYRQEPFPKPQRTDL